MVRLRFPTIPTSRRSIVLHVNYLQKINLKRVGADLLLTIYRSEKSFVTRRYNVMKNGHRRDTRGRGPRAAYAGNSSESTTNYAP